jgi:KAP family P-loop domain
VEKLLQPEEVDDLEEKGEKPTRSFQRIILYIDDLDRCPPKKVVEVLQAIHLLLYFRLFVVVVAVDARWVSRALKAHYPELISDREISGRARGRRVDGRPPDQRPADARDYLEKIFQIPYWVCEMDDEKSIEFVDGLVGPLVETPKADPRGAVSADAGQKHAEGEKVENPTPAGATPDGQELVAQQTDGANSTVTKGETGIGDGTNRAIQEEAKRAVEFAQMRLSKKEGELIAAFAPFVGGSPRRAKRYLNLYLLLKTSLELGPSDRLGQRALMTLLAIVTGLGRPTSFFDVLKRVGEDKPRLEALSDALTSEGSSANSRRADEIIRKLMAINSKDHIPDGPEIVAALQKLAPIVRRYSF